MNGLILAGLATLVVLCMLPWMVLRNALGLLFSGCMVLLCLALSALSNDPFTMGMVLGPLALYLLLLGAINPFTMGTALGPLALYLLLLGAINLYRRPFVVTGVRDTAALGLAAGGMVLIGPIQLFFPTVASIGMGAWVWVLLVTLYALLVVFLSLLFRPRLVVYNIAPAELRPILAEVAGQLDDAARWAGDSLHLPALGVQLHMESLPLLRNISLASSGPAQDHSGWRRLELALTAALGRLEVPRNASAVVLISTGLILLVFLVAAVSDDPQAVANALLELLQS
jgi:hypothetical protein